MLNPLFAFLFLTQITTADYDESLGELLADKLEDPQKSSLDIYGFMDFTYRHFLLRKNSPFKGFVNFPYPSFAIGNLNVYLDGHLTSKWRSLVEVRLTYLPHGQRQAVNPATGEEIRYDTTISDYNDEDRNSLRYGAIEIERASIEYKAHDLFTLTAGQWLTPYGVWNIDHGTPTVISIERPYSIGEALFPERQVGLQASGVLPWHSMLFGYHVTFSNGRGPIDSYRDLDGNKAFGGRLYWQNTNLGKLVIGASIYGGKYTDRKRIYASQTINGTPQIVPYYQRTEEFDEMAYAVDIHWDWNNFVLVSEWIMNNKKYSNSARPIIIPSTGIPELAQDFSRYGTYALLGYRTPFFGIMPYTLIEYLEFGNDPLIPAIFQSVVGINWRLELPVVLKVQYVYAYFPGASNNSFAYKENLQRLSAQIAVLF